MQLKIGLLNTFQVLTSIGLELRDNGTHFEFEDPECPGMRFRLVGSGIVETSDTRQFIAGDKLDYLAFRMRGYAGAIDLLIRSYGDVLSGGAYAPIVYRDHDIIEATSTRCRFMTLMGMLGNIMSDSKLSPIRCWLDKNHISARTVGGLLIGMTGEEIARHLVGKFDKTGLYVLFPYMQSPWKIASFRVVNVRNSTHQIIDLEASHLSFFGLPGCGHLPTYVFTSDLEVCRAYSEEFIDPLRCSGNVFVRVDPAGVASDFQLPIGILPDRGAFAALLAHRRGFVKLYVAQMGRELVDLRAYLVHELVDMLACGDGTGALQLLAAALRNDRDLQNLLEDDLRALGRQDLIPRLQAQLDQGMTFTWRKFVVSETPAGLLAQRDNQRVLFTNFTTRIDYNLTFPDSPDEIFHVGRVLFAGSAYPIQIRRKNLNRFRDIEQLVASAVSQVDKGSKKLPAFTDSSYHGALITLLNRQVAEATTKQGIDQLGWRRDQFITPTWISSPTGIVGTSLIPHPGRTHFLQLCQFQSFVPADLGIDIPASSWTAICLTVGMSLRWYLRAATGPLPTSRDAVTMRIIQAVLFGLNQKGPFKMNYTTRFGGETSFIGMNGFPCMTACPIPSIAAAIKVPCFLLSEAGLRLGPALTEDQVGQTAHVARAVFQNVTMRFLRSCGTDHRLYDEQQTFSTLVREGREAVERYTIYRNIPMIEPQEFQTVVSGTSVTGSS